MDGSALKAPLLANEAPISSFMISVKTLAGKSIALHNLKRGDTIASLKIKIFDSAVGCPISEQTLIHAGRKLDDDSTLAHYNLTSGAIIYLVLGRAAADGSSASGGSAAVSVSTPEGEAETAAVSVSTSSEGEAESCPDHMQEHTRIACQPTLPSKPEPLTELPRPSPPSPAVSPSRWASRYDLTRSGQHGRACLRLTDLLLSGSAEQRAAVKRPQSFTLEQLEALDLASDPVAASAKEAAAAAGQEATCHRSSTPRFSDNDLAKLRQERQERQGRLSRADAALKQAAHDRAEASKELDAIDRELRRAIAFCVREPKLTSGAMPPASAIAAWLGV